MVVNISIEYYLYVLMKEAHKLILTIILLLYHKAHYVYKKLILLNFIHNIMGQMLVNDADSLIFAVWSLPLQYSDSYFFYEHCVI